MKIKLIIILGNIEKNINFKKIKRKNMSFLNYFIYYKWLKYNFI